MFTDFKYTSQSSDTVISEKSFWSQLTDSPNSMLLPLGAFYFTYLNPCDFMARLSFERYKPTIKL